MNALRYWRLAVAIVVELGLYLAFAASVDSAEILVGLASTIVSTVAVAAYIKQGKLNFRFHWIDVLQIWRMPWYAVEGTWDVLRALAFQLFGRGAASFLGAVAYPAADRNDPFCAGRRALVVTYTTMTPNFVVLGIVHEERLLLYHQILPGKIRRLTENLGAEL